MEKTVVILGAGLAGLMCAIKCAEADIKVKLVAKDIAERSESVMAAGGINAALNTKGEEDKPYNHYEDTIKAGVFIADKDAVKGMADRAPAIIEYLASIGTMFNRTDDGKIDLRNFGGQKNKRTAYAKSSTGKQVITALVQEVRKYEAQGIIDVYDHHSFVTYISGKDNECIGCIIKDDIGENYLSINSSSVVICSGGMNGVFGKTTGCSTNTGEVTAELFNKGVALSNLEFIQYHPTTAELPGKRMLISESARGEGGRLFTYKNGEKWYFMEELYPEMGALMPRDVVSKEIYRVCRESGQREVYLDLTHLSRDVLENKLSSVVEDCKKYLNFDPAKDYIPVYPGIHYFMGGIYADINHETSVKNLYAAGECCTQYHGANRLGGNSMMGALYGGIKAAESIMENENSEVYSEDEMKQYDEAENQRILSEINTLKQNKNKRSLNAIKKKYHEIMNECLGIVRDEKTLRAGVDVLQDLYKTEVQDNYDKNSSDLENYAVKNMVYLGQAILKSALERKESRGAHLRSDYPQRNDEKYQKISRAVKENDIITISFAEH